MPQQLIRAWEVSRQVNACLGTWNLQCPNKHHQFVHKPTRLFVQTKLYSCKCCSQLKKVDARVSHRYPSCFGHSPDPLPCVEHANILIKKANLDHGKSICSFLKTHYFPREPSLKGLWVNPNSEYVQFLSDMYSYTPSMDRYMALEYLQRTGEYKLLGVLVASKKLPWYSKEMELWGLATSCPVARTHILFQSHVYASSDIFNKYKIPYIYNIDVLVTDEEIAVHGVAQLLLRRALARAIDVKHPLVQLVCTNAYMVNGCRRVNMTKDWSMEYEELTDYRGRLLFCRQYPQTTVSVFTRRFNQLKPLPNICDDPLLHEAFDQMIHEDRHISAKYRQCFTRDNMGVSKRKSEREAKMMPNIYTPPLLTATPGSLFKCYEVPMPR